MSMKIGQKPNINKAAAAVISSALMASFASNMSLGTFTVTDVTDWKTAPMEVPYANLTVFAL